MGENAMNDSAIYSRFPPTPSDLNPKWEYLRLNTVTGRQLDEIGRDGWELVSVYVTTEVWHIFKRRVAG
jgi:hypothetical protein